LVDDNVLEEMGGTMVSFLSIMFMVCIVLLPQSVQGYNIIMPGEDLVVEEGENDQQLPAHDDHDDFDATLLNKKKMTTTVKFDYEDVIVMQTEMAWGAQEMKRYKSLRGQWPVRSELEGRSSSSSSSTTRTRTTTTSSSNNNSFSSIDKNKKAPELGAIDGMGSLFRGDGQEEYDADDVDYWKYLISIF